MAAFDSVEGIKRYVIDEYYNGPPNSEVEQALIFGFLDTGEYNLVLLIKEHLRCTHRKKLCFF